MLKAEILVLDYLPDDDGKYKLLSWRLTGGVIEYELSRLSNREEFIYRDENRLLHALKKMHRGMVFRLSGRNGQTQVKTIINLI